jgi:hypothetical protein
MYKKIDIFANGVYICSTNQAKGLKEAKEKFYKNPNWMGITPQGIGLINIKDWSDANNWGTYITCHWAE